MSFLDKKIGSFSMFQFIGIVGAVLVIISFFLAWGTATITPMFGDEHVTNYAGMEFFNKEMWAQNSDAYNAWQNFIPLVTLALAVIALIISIVPGEYLGGEKTEKSLGLVSIIIAIALLLMVVLFMTWFGDMTGSLDVIFLTAEVSFGVGTYVCLAGSIMVFIVGIMPLLKRVVA